MRSLMGSMFFLIILVILDLYVFQAVKAVSSQSGQRTKWVVYGGYWLVSVATIGFFIALPYLNINQAAAPWRTYLFASLIGILIAKLLSVSFFIVDDLRRVVQWVMANWVFKHTDAAPGHEDAEAISRSTFLSWLGLGVGGTLFATMVYGFKNKYNYQVRRVQLAFDSLPPAFRGLRIAHISDIHSGSFMDREAVLRGVEMVNNQQPDLILFTGDLVNDRASEMNAYMDIFSQLQAPMGVYSTLGNHDYGDYASWPSQDDKQHNLEALKQIHQKLGWKLLLDEGLTFERNGEEIALIGVENISGKGSFHSYGSLQKAYEKVAAIPFKILMSHDPSHWDAEVIPTYSDINLTLSGHTHGMQFGLELPGFKWSPVKWMYKQWAGLYETGAQKLYVNRGFGFIGYPGRVGIMPEITVIELT